MIHTYTLPNKLKIVVGFYMIATKIDDVYQVRLPEEVRALLQVLRIVISLGIEGVPLACVGANGYVARLLFWMLAPAALVTLANSIVAMHLLARRRLTSWSTVLQHTAPIALRIVFVA